jgi:hypothetical protein
MSAVDAIREQHALFSALQAENRRLRELNDYLLQAVDLLSLPRVTDGDVLYVRDGLLALQMPHEVTH